MARSCSKSPLTSSVTKLSRMRLGLEMNSGLKGTNRNTACHAAKKIATARMPSSTLRCLPAKLRVDAAWSGIGQPARSDGDLVLEGVTDFQLELVEFRRHPHLVVARARQADGEDLLGAAGPLGHHHDAVGQIDRLVDLVGDEQNGLLRLLPDAEQFY